MQWSRDMRIARRSVRTALRAASAMARAQSNSLRRSPGVAEEPKAVSQLVEQPEFGSNPGRLAMYSLPASPPDPGRCPAYRPVAWMRPDCRQFRSRRRLG